MPCRAIQDEWVTVESSDKMWSAGEGKGKPLQYACLENPVNSMERQNTHMNMSKRKVSDILSYPAQGDRISPYRKNGLAIHKWKNVIPAIRNRPIRKRQISSI